MGPQKQTSKQRIAVLEAENIRLRAEVDQQKSKRSRAAERPVRSWRWRSLLIGLMVAFAGALLITGNILFWSARSITDTKRYTAIVTPLIEQPEIQQAIAKKTTDSLFTQINVEQVAREALPPKAEFLAPTLSKQVQSFTNQQAQKILASSKFQEIWINVNTSAHERLINFVRNYQGDGTIDLSDIYTQLSQSLSGTQLSFLAGKTLPAKIGQINVVNAPNLPKIHWLVVNLNWLRFATILLFIVLSYLAIQLAAQKRKMIIRISLYYASLLLILLVSVRVGRQVAVNQVSSDYQSAASAAWQIILHSFVLQTICLLVISLLVALIAWVTGSGKRAVAARGRVVQLLNGNLHQSLFSKENRVTKLIGKYKAGLQWSIVTIAGIGLLFINLKLTTILWYGIIALFAVIAIEILAAPQK